jgi:hypothetical protein
MGEIIKLAATEGVLIRGRVVQTYDAAKERPEIIRAEAIYIGEGLPRDFEISRVETRYIKPPPLGLASCDSTQRDKLGVEWPRIVLVPKKRTKFTTEGWEVLSFAPVRGDGLAELLVEAKKYGRLRQNPPRVTYNTGDTD